MAVIVVNYASHRMIDENLGRVPWSELEIRVVIVDSFSTAAELVAVRSLALARGWELVSLPKNNGFGAGVNAGIAAARTLGCVCFLLLNPDAIVTSQVVTALRAHSLREPLALITPRIESSLGAPVFCGSRVQLSSGRIRGTRPALQTVADSTPSRGAGEWLPGTCLVVHDKLLELIGGFDESYFLYWEDVDISYRCEQAGGSLLIRRDLVAAHDEGGTQGRRPGRAKSGRYYFYNCRNRLLFAARHLDRSSILRWIALTPVVSWEILMRGGRRQLLRSPRPLAATVAGSVAGLGPALRGLARPQHAEKPSGGNGLNNRFRFLTDTGAPTGNQDHRVVESPDEADVTTVTVAMLTFHRPADVSRVVPTVLAQAAELSAGSADHYRVDALVVDNDPMGSASTILWPYIEHGLRYVIEPLPGIAAARNRAIDESAGSDLLVFIDDDESPHPTWLRTLLDTHARTGAAAVSGPVVSEFEGTVDPWILAGGFLDRRHRADLPTGAAIRSAATNNLLVDLREVRRLGLRFDNSWGLSGGEDTLFTRTLYAHGGKIVWSGESVVTDHVPAARMNRPWVLRRALGHGNNESRVEVAMADNGWRRFTARAGATGRGVTRVAGGMSRYVVGLGSRSHVHQARGMRTAARGAGMLLGAGGYRYRAYGQRRGGRKRR